MIMDYTYKYAPLMSYETTPSVIIRSDGACIPMDESNSDYAAIMALVAEGKLTIAEAE
jgi:hypothetical protein